MCEQFIRPSQRQTQNPMLQVRCIHQLHRQFRMTSPSDRKERSGGTQSQQRTSDFSSWFCFNWDRCSSSPKIDSTASQRLHQLYPKQVLEVFCPVPALDLFGHPKVLRFRPWTWSWNRSSSQGGWWKVGGLWVWREHMSRPRSKGCEKRESTQKYSWNTAWN